MPFIDSWEINFRKGTMIIAIIMVMLSFIPILRIGNFTGNYLDNSFFLNTAGKVDEKRDGSVWYYSINIIERTMMIPAFFMDSTLTIIFSVTHSFCSGFLLLGVEFKKSSCIKPWLVLALFSLTYNLGTTILLVTVGAVNYLTSFLFLIYALQAYFIFIVKNFNNELRLARFDGTRGLVNDTSQRGIENFQMANESIHMGNEPPPSYDEAVRSPPAYKNDCAPPAEQLSTAISPDTEQNTATTLT